MKNIYTNFKFNYVQNLMIKIKVKNYIFFIKEIATYEKL